MADSAPPAAPGGSTTGERKRLSREEWLRRELEAERLRKRSEARSKARVDKLKAGVHVFGDRKAESVLRARAQTRARTIEARPAKLRELLHELQADASTAYLVIGLKRILNARGWSPVELCSRRVLALLLFLRAIAVPHAWNARHVRPMARRGSKRLSSPERLGGHLGTARKYTPCARAVDQREILTALLAAEGHCDDDDRSCHVKTVQRVLRLLEDVSLVQAVQVPPSAAEPWEIGESGWAFNRYYIATPGSPKPALMGVWTQDDTCGAEMLAQPWTGMVPRAAADPPTA